MTHTAVETFDTLVATERAALIVVRLMLGERLTTRQVADYVGIGVEGARLMMGKISRVGPFRQNECWEWECTRVEWPY